MDGMTFGVKADTSTGHFEVRMHYNEDNDDDSDWNPQTNYRVTNMRYI